MLLHIVDDPPQLRRTAIQISRPNTPERDPEDFANALASAFELVHVRIEKAIARKELGK